MIPDSQVEGPILVGDFSFLVFESVGNAKRGGRPKAFGTVVYPESLLRFVREAPVESLLNVMEWYGLRPQESRDFSETIQQVKDFAKWLEERESTYGIPQKNGWQLGIEPLVMILRDIEMGLRYLSVPLKELLAHSFHEIAHAITVGVEGAKRYSLAFLGKAKSLENKTIQLLRKVRQEFFRFVKGTTALGRELSLSLRAWIERKRDILRILLPPQQDLLRYSGLVLCVAVPLLLFAPTKWGHLNPARAVEHLGEIRDVLVLVYNGHAWP